MGRYSRDFDSMERVISLFTVIFNFSRTEDKEEYSVRGHHQHGRQPFRVQHRFPDQNVGMGERQAKDDGLKHRGIRSMGKKVPEKKTMAG